ncbi:MAG: DUF3277 family protein [Alphaproteobacteria bacterium]|nr:DUF3277 family protein [Alphaproteobacteria bacterium]
MADSLPVYSAREVACAWGLVNMEGFSNDNIVTFAYNTDLTTETIGADGQLATSVTPDRSGTIKVELMQTSLTTRQLAGILAYQNNQSDTAAIIKADFAVSDPSGSVLCVARNAYLKTAPEVALGVEQATHEWTWYSEKIDFLSIPRGLDDAAFATEVAAIVAGMVASSAR